MRAFCRLNFVNKYRDHHNNISFSFWVFTTQVSDRTDHANGSHVWKQLSKILPSINPSLTTPVTHADGTPIIKGGGQGTVHKIEYGPLTYAMKIMDGDFAFYYGSKEVCAALLAGPTSRVAQPVMMGVVTKSKTGSTIMELRPVIFYNWIPGYTLWEMACTPSPEGFHGLDRNNLCYELCLTLRDFTLSPGEVVHGDFKGNNLIVPSMNGGRLVVTIIDMGLSSLKGQRIPGPSRNKCRPKDTGNYAASFDIFSLGLLLGDTLNPVPYTKKGNRSQGILCEGIKDPATRALVKQCLALDSHKRPSIQELVTHFWKR